MPVLSLKIINEQGTILAEHSAEDEVMLVYEEEYKPGDKIILTSTEKDIHLMVQLDDAMASSFVYITKNELIYYIPFEEKKISYSPNSFSGNIHLLSARLAASEEIGNYKNLALNVFDQHGDTGCYPHATANVETRDESVFAARNAIDGVKENRSHGKWPYQSWGINRQDDAELRLEFGRKVKINKIVLYTRADFPHDNWWEEVNLAFSDGTGIKWQLEKSYKPHILNIEEKEIEWLLLNNLIKADDPSPFPALTQIEVYGVEAN